MLFINNKGCGQWVTLRISTLLWRSGGGTQGGSTGRVYSHMPPVLMAPAERQDYGGPVSLTGTIFCRCCTNVISSKVMVIKPWPWLCYVHTSVQFYHNYSVYCLRGCGDLPSQCILQGVFLYILQFPYIVSNTLGSPISGLAIAS